VEAWEKSGKKIDNIEEIEPTEFAIIYSALPPFQLIDARRKSEYDTEHLVDAISFPLDFINRDLTTLNADKKYYIHCAGGYRSVIMASILKKNGYNKVVNIKGGYSNLSKTSLARTRHQEVNTEL
jgi:rhodanese-related sulfurtransferase